MSTNTCFQTSTLLSCDLEISSQKFEQYEALLTALSSALGSVRIEGWYQTQSYVSRMTQIQELSRLAQDRQYLLHLEVALLDQSNTSIHIHWNDQSWLFTKIRKIEQVQNAQYYYTKQAFLAIEPGYQPKTNTNTRVNYEVFWKKYELNQLQTQGDQLSYQPNQPYCARFISSI